MKRGAAKNQRPRRRGSSRKTKLPPAVNAPNSHRGLGAGVVAVITFFLGLGGALHLTGWVTAFASIYDPLPSTWSMVIGLALLGTAVGMWIPQHLVASLMRLAWRRFSGVTRLDGGSLGGVLANRDEKQDASLSWLVLAVSLVLAGFGSFVSGLTVQWVSWTDRFLIHSFLWTETTLLLAEAVLAGMALAVPWMLMGIVLACIYTLGSRCWPSMRRTMSLISLLTLGAAAGWQIGMGWLLPVTSATALLLTGSLPLLIAVVPAVHMAGRTESNVHPESDSHEPLLPEESGGLTWLLLACTATWGVAVGASIVTWHRVTVTGFASEPKWIAGAGLPFWVMGSMAAGMTVAGRRATQHHRSVGEYGVVLAIMGVGQAMVVLLAGWACWTQAVIADGGTPRRWLWLGLLGVAGFAAGHALPYGKRALMARSGSEPLTHAEIVSIVGGGLGIGCVISAWWLIGAIGTMATLAVMALVTLAAGGTLIIQGSAGARSVRTTVARVGGLVVALTVLTVLLPSVSSRWIRVATADGADLREGNWLTRSSGDVAAGSWAEFIGHRLGAAWSNETKPVGIAWAIGVGSDGVSALEGFNFARVDVTALDPSLGTEPTGSNRSTLSTPALREMRWTRRRYDAIVVGATTPGHRSNADLWTLEALTRLHRATAPGGVVAICVPLTGLSDEAVALTARGFGRVFGPSTGWIAGPDPWGGSAVWLVARRKGPRDATAYEALAPAPLETLTQPDGVANRDEFHSAWAPRLTLLPGLGPGIARQFIEKTASATLNASLPS